MQVRTGVAKAKSLRNGGVGIFETDDAIRTELLETLARAAGEEGRMKSQTLSGLGKR